MCNLQGKQKVLVKSVHFPNDGIKFGGYENPGHGGGFEFSLPEQTQSAKFPFAGSDSRAEKLVIFNSRLLSLLA